MGLLSNRFDVEQSINDAMVREARQFGQLASSRFAPMTASTYGQEAMAGRAIGGMMGGQDPLMRKQNIVDDIMARYPNPDTQEEMNKIADELAENGLTDLSIEIRNVGIELAKTQKTLTTPSKDLLDQISFGLTSSFLTEGFIDQYMLEFNSTYMAGYAGSSKKEGMYSPTEYKRRRAAAKKELENQFEAYRNSISRDKKMTVNEINNLLSNETLLMQGFKDWAKKRSGNKMSEFLDKNMVIGFVSGAGGGGLDSDETDVQTNGEPPEGAVGYSGDYSKDYSSEANQALNIQGKYMSVPEQFNIDADKMMEGKKQEELQTLYDSLLQQSIGVDGIPSPSNLDGANRALFRKLMEKLGLDSMGNKQVGQTASAFSGDNQQWFMDVLA